MPRADARANAVADAVVTRLRTINSGTPAGANQYGQAADADKWLTKPVSVVRQLMADALTMAARPHIAVEVAQIKDAFRGGGVHVQTVTIDVHLIAGTGGDSESQLAKLAADVMFAISQDETIGGVAIQFPAEGTEENAFEYALQTEIMLKTAGLAMATVRFAVDTRWDHTTTNPS